jgi:hypothetical protein
MRGGFSGLLFPVGGFFSFPIISSLQASISLPVAVTAGESDQSSRRAEAALTASSSDTCS